MHQSSQLVPFYKYSGEGHLCL